MSRPFTLTLLVVAMIGLAAIAYPPVAERIQAGMGSSASETAVRVTNPGDSGPGTLRAAIFAALRSDQALEILLETPRVQLSTPLPPLAMASGLMISGVDERHVIDASGMGSGAVLHIQGDNITLRNFTIEGALDRAIQVQGSDARLMDIEIIRCNIAVSVVAGPRLRLTDSTFDDNRFGIQMAGRPAAMSVDNSRFSNHREAAIWAVGAEDFALAEDRVLEIRGNDFDGDRYGIVAAGFPVLVAGNHITGSTSAGVLVMGSGAEVLDNRIRAGAGMGILAIGAISTVIKDNEIDHHQAVGILLRDSTGVAITQNKVYSNAYGIATVGSAPQSGSIFTGNVVTSSRHDGLLVIGDSSVFTRNRLLKNGGAGLRILDLARLNQTLAVANPLLQGNVTQNNGIDRPERGVYEFTADDA